MMLRQPAAWRSRFLTLNSAVALAVGSFAGLLPRALLDSKGVVAPSAAVELWVREVGVLIFALGALLFLVRKHPSSRTLRAVLIGNALVHLGLLPLELVAYHLQVITRMSGVAPNSVLHGLLATGSLFFASRGDEGA